MWNALRRISLTKWILISMGLGIFIGWAFPETTPAADSAESAPFQSGDFADLPSLAAKLKSSPDTVSTHLRGKLPDTTKEALASYSATNSAPLRVALLEDLNRIISTESLYEAQRFGGVNLRAETKLLLATAPQGGARLRLNRLLLEDAYPAELAKNRPAYPMVARNLKVVSKLFLNLIKCIIVPILVGTLIIGIAGHSDDLKAVGRLAFKSFIYFEVVTTLALAIGLAAVNLTKPGVGVVLPPSADKGKEFAAKTQTTQEMIEHIAPRSFFESAANNDVLQVVVFTILFAVALSQVKGKPKETMLNFFEGLSEVMFKFTGLVMLCAPFGIGAAMAVTVGHSGMGVLKNLAVLVLTLYGALVVFCLVVLVPVALWARIPLRKFLRAVKEPALIAFSTTSSDAALPDALKRMTEFGVPKRIVSFVLPTGYSFNLDGSTLYLAIASVFVAQAAGVDMTLGQQLMMMLTLMLTTKGIAAVPRASLVILSGTLASFGLPLEGVAIILGVDELMDMARTTVNLVGNCLASAVMARWEGELKTEDQTVTPIA